MGGSGLKTCIFFSCLCLFGGPISPLICLHLMQQRTKINAIYDDDFKLSQLTCLNYIPTCICWPYNLYEQYTFLKCMKERGRLVFDWDLANYSDFLKKPKQHEFETKKLFLLGPHSEGKKELFRKLLKYCENNSGVTSKVVGDVVEQTADGKMKEINFDTDEDLLIERNTIKVGIKSFIRVNGQVHFLEIWNVPNKELHALSVEMAMPHSVAVIFCFDGCGGDRVLEQQSFSEMQDMYIETVDFHPHTKFCVCVNHIEAALDSPSHNPSQVSATRHNSVYASSTATATRHNSLMGASPTNRASFSQGLPAIQPTFKMETAVRWADGSDMEFCKVSTVYNEGIRELSQSITDLILEAKTPREV